MNQQRASSGPLTYESYLVGMGLLTSSYPPRTASADSGDALLAAWWTVLEPYASGADPWLTCPVFDRAVRDTLESVTDYLPAPGLFLSFCKYARAALEEERVKKLPAPPRVAGTRPNRAVVLWQLATGKARARKRFGLIDAYRLANDRPPNTGVPEDCWRGQDEPTDDEIRACLPAAEAMIGPRAFEPDDSEERAIMPALAQVAAALVGEWPA